MTVFILEESLIRKLSSASLLKNDSRLTAIEGSIRVTNKDNLLQLFLQAN